MRPYPDDLGTASGGSSTRARAARGRALALTAGRPRRRDPAGRRATGAPRRCGASGEEGGREWRMASSIGGVETKQGEDRRRKERRRPEEEDARRERGMGRACIYSGGNGWDV